MAARKADEAEQWLDDVVGRRQQARSPRPIAEVLSQLLARKGYGRSMATEELQSSWQQVAGARWGPHSRPGTLNRGVLEILVRNSTVLQEMVFEKHRLLNGFCALVPRGRIRDLRFRVDEVD
jgi:predicted nucleic acid-binding Zn ribbon protein